MSKPSSIPEIDATVSNDPRWALVQRVASSQHFRAAARLREFLLYVAECAIRNSPEDATEQQIGIHVFHRAPGYNSSEDSIVRTHARLLRQKLTEYFVGEGAQEEVVLEIPKGHYLPVFRPAGPHYPPPQPIEVSHFQERASLAPALPVPIVPGRFSGRLRKIGTGIAICFLLVLSAAVFWWVRPKPLAIQSEMETFWHPFLSGGQPLVIYSNALFQGDSKNGLRLAPAETSPNQPLPDHFIDHYTGIGEVAAVYNLTRLFDAHHATFVLKRSLLVTWDEARLRNLIFIGSRAENPALKMLPSTSDFTMVEGTDSAGFVNHHPKPGEPALYSRPDYPLTKDYAVLALLPGVQQGKWILIFSGLTTLGTQAAVEYAARPEDVAALLHAASFKKGEIRPFEAVLETTIVGGVPMETKLVSIRTH